MAESTTIARPYAQAVFELAKETGQLDKWSESLAFVSSIVSNADMVVLLGNPKLSSDTKADVMISVCEGKVDASVNNLLRTMSENDRLTVLPAVHSIFEELKAEAEKTVIAEITSALPVDDAQISKLSNALKARLGCDVEVTCSVDESLLGGAIIRAGDMVIDGSVAGQIERLSIDLTH